MSCFIDKLFKYGMHERVCVKGYSLGDNFIICQDTYN